MFRCYDNFICWSGRYATIVLFLPEMVWCSKGAPTWTPSPGPPSLKQPPPSPNCSDRQADDLFQSGLEFRAQLSAVYRSRSQFGHKPDPPGEGGRVLVLKRRRLRNTLCFVH